MTTIWIGYEGVPHEGYGEPEMCFATKEAAHEWAAEMPDTLDTSSWRELLEFPAAGGPPVPSKYSPNHVFSDGAGYGRKPQPIFCRRCVQEACAHECVVIEHYNRLIHRCTKCGHDRFEPMPATQPA